LPASARWTVLRNARLLDGTGAPPRPGVDVVLEGGTIVTVATTGHPHPPGEAEVVDLQGRTLMPGLIDCHVHLTFSGEPQEVERAATVPVPDLAWTAATSARETLEGGITTVRDVGARAGVAIRLREAIAAGRLPGPRMRAAGAIICMTGGHGWFIGREADGPDEVRRAVREQLKAGADCLKFTATGGGMTPGVDPRASSFTEAELTAGVEEAHKAFRRAIAHAQGNAGIRNAVRAGIDSVEHGVYLDDEVVEEMRQRGTFLVPTLVAPTMIAHHGTKAGIPDYVVVKASGVLEIHRESFRKAVRAGVRIAMGTDAGTPFNQHGANAQELALMVECGLSPADTIVAATRNAAEILDLLDVTGTVEPGKAADLLVVDGDPLADVRILGNRDRLLGIVKDGRWVRRARALGGS
jgi:imidazolonepropionase-like amidohydrolase